MTDEYLKKAALNACELLERWSGDTVVPMSDFRAVHKRAIDLNAAIVRGEFVVLPLEEYNELIANQRKTKRKK
jgi:hypothetical protein